MGYTLVIWSIATFIESRVKEDINYDELEKITGFSYRHIRSVIKKVTGVSLSNYILNRRIANAAFDMIHTGKSLTDIAYDYNFNSYDSFARAFKRISGKSPAQFRSGDNTVGNRRILMGFYAPEIYKADDITFTHLNISEGLDMNKDMKMNTDSCILFGVPKVAYSYDECTPLGVSLKAALNYMGEKIDYTYVMACMGASFRLRWNKDYWDGGNVDVLNIYENEFDILKHAFKGINRDFSFIHRDGSCKEDFKKFIRTEIDKGNPVVALGIIGPPEAGVITGYEKNGDVLLGWNCFQENKELAKDVKYHDCGYYITENWWENPDTLALISIGDKNTSSISQKEIIDNGLAIMLGDTLDVKKPDGTVRDTFACGQSAYDLWYESILDDSQFSKELVMPLMIEKLMCQGDAQAMVCEGRNYAAAFIEWVGKTNPHVDELCKKAADVFRKGADCALKMYDIRGGFEHNQKILNNFAKRDVRVKTAELIQKAKNHEKEACGILAEISSKL